MGVADECRCCFYCLFNVVVLNPAQVPEECGERRNYFRRNRTTFWITTVPDHFGHDWTSWCRDRVGAPAVHEYCEKATGVVVVATFRLLLLQQRLLLPLMMPAPTVSWKHRTRTTTMSGWKLGGMSHTSVARSDVPARNFFVVGVASKNCSGLSGWNEERQDDTEQIDAVALPNYLLHNVSPCFDRKTALY